MSDEQKGILGMDDDTDCRRTLAGVLREGKLMTLFEESVFDRLTTLFLRRFTVAEADLIRSIYTRCRRVRKV